MPRALTQCQSLCWAPVTQRWTDPGAALQGRQERRLIMDDYKRVLEERKWIHRGEAGGFWLLERRECQAMEAAPQHHRVASWMAAEGGTTSCHPGSRASCDSRSCTGYIQPSSFAWRSSLSQAWSDHSASKCISLLLNLSVLCG